ncbi:MAG TPA: PAS domain S-box protein [Leeuwenhoekiella sp.]|nr:PAS domain S-box protein [Leeuwenhoekiella sp.]
MKKINAHEEGADYIVLIGASAGGLQAFKEFLSAVKKDSSLSYIFLQHLDPSHKSLLPELLQSSSAIPVIEISHGLILESDKAYVLPSNSIPTLTEGVFSLHKKQGKSGSSHLLDNFFQAVANEYVNKVIGVVLSGTGNDGTRGLKEIKNKQGITFAQDLNSAKWSGMPQHATDEGVVDFVLPPAEIVKKIYGLNLSKAPVIEHIRQDDDSYDNILSQILQILQQQEGMDFSNYKKNTILRRIKRRVVLNGNKNLIEYLGYFKNNKDEVEQLFNDLLISVTDFFRDKSTFDFLKEQIFPKLIAGKGREEPLRIWVAGCSTGQEAYSVAMCLKDYLEGVGEDNPYGEVYTAMEDHIKIFATDLSAQAIAKARKGIYKSAEMGGIDKAYLKTYFTHTNSGYQVIKELRKMCVFAEHDFLNDFPFGSMNLVTCRNVLIYMDGELQKKALTNFHYALKEKGVLLLGNSESISSVPELFNSIDKSHKIYRRSDSKRKTLAPIGKNKVIKIPKLPKSAAHKNNKPDTRDYAETILLENYTPVAVVIDQNLDLISIHGKTGRYLEHTSGNASNNILKLAKGSLGFEIRQLVKNFNPDAKKKQAKDNIKLIEADRQYSVSIEVRLLNDIKNSNYLVIFSDYEVKEEQHEVKQKDEKGKRIGFLEEELAGLRDEMLTASEEHQIVEEELQSANEELMSGTEELQTLNEELETSKEELQSTVEEITVVNQELYNLNTLLTQEKKFSEAIVRTIRDPLLILNKKLEIIMANKAFYKNFKVSEINTMGRSVYELGNGQWDIPKLHTLLESILPVKESFKDYEVTHYFQGIGKRSMLLNGQILQEEDHDEGSIFLSFEDITARKEARNKLKESVSTHHEFIRSSPWPIAILKDEDLKVEIVNSAMLKVWEKSDDIVDQPLVLAVPELAGTDVMRWLQEVYSTGIPHEAFQQSNRIKRKDGKREYFDVIYQALRNIDGKIIGVSIIATVVTDQVFLNEKVRKSEKQFRQLTNHLPELIVSYDVRDKTYYYNKSFLDFTGLSLKTLDKEEWHCVLHPDDYERMMEEYGGFIERAENFEIELRIRNKEGNYLWCLNRNHCITDVEGNALRWIGTNTIIQRLKDEEKRKEGFLKLVSHELKTPVTSIKGYVQMLLSMISKDASRPISSLPIESSLMRVENQITRLTHLISEMLDLSRMEESKLDLNLEEFNMCELVEETIQDVQHSSGMVHIDSDYIDECQVKADKDRIGQVLINFITNAIKYSPENKDIRVKVFQEEPDLISVSVKDSGIGINEEDLIKIFDRFYRVSGKNEGTYAGFGIGLYLAKEIIDRHNGKIKVESKLGEGSNFIFSLPHET